MKKKCAFWIGVLFLILNLESFGQGPMKTLLQPSRLNITNNITTNIIFPYGIRSGDCGSKDVLVQKAAGVENILQVKAGKIGFEETNLSVVTNDGSFYSYILNFSKVPTEINIMAEDPQVKSDGIVVFSEDATTAKISKNADQVLNNRRSIKNKRAGNNEVFLDLKGVFIDNDVLYLQLFLQNRSVISYDVKSLKIYIRDMQKSKRTASQEIELPYLYVLGNVKRIESGSERTVVIAISKLTIPDKKTMAIELMESNGGRNLSIRLGNATIMKAEKVN